ncbi:MAG: hypothetical protein ABW223_07155, partial [Rariglobus sp.]
PHPTANASGASSDPHPTSATGSTDSTAPGSASDPATSAGSINASNAPTAPGIAPLPLEPTGGISILPDDTPRVIRAEDVLMYFQYPLAAPANITPPPSSATYELK